MKNEGIVIKDMEAYLINHENDYIRMYQDYEYDYDEIKKGSEWLKEYRSGDVPDDFEFTAYEDDGADYYDIRIEVF